MMAATSIADRTTLKPMGGTLLESFTPSGMI